MTIRRGESGIVPLEIIRDGEAEFTDNGRPVAAAVVVAGFLEVGGGRLAGAGVVDAVVVGPFEVAVVVVGGEEVVGEILVRVAGAPFCVLCVHVDVSVNVDAIRRLRGEEERERERERKSYHHLDMKTIVRVNVEGGFCGSYARPCGGIVSLPHGICLTVAALYGLVEYFQHADIPVIGIRVDDVCHPFEEFVCALVLVVYVEAW